MSISPLLGIQPFIHSFIHSINQATGHLQNRLLIVFFYIIMLEMKPPYIGQFV